MLNATKVTNPCVEEGHKRQTKKQDSRTRTCLYKMHSKQRLNFTRGQSQMSDEGAKGPMMPKSQCLIEGKLHGGTSQASTRRQT